MRDREESGGEEEPIGGETGRHVIARWKHRMGTSLSQIIGFTKLLVETVEEESAAELLPQFREMRQACEGMNQQLEGLLSGSESVWSRDALQRLIEAFAEPLDRLDVARRRSSELADALGARTLQSDLNEVHEIVGGLRQVAGSFYLKTREGISRPGFASSSRLAPGTMVPFAANMGHEGARLLLVDDDQINRVVIGRRLKKMGFAVEVAASGLMALDMLAIVPVDLVMLDIMMPELDGFSTLERIKTDLQMRDIPVIMLTALDDAASIARCLSSGAEDYVSKPFDATVLRARINAALDRKFLREKERKLLERIQVERNKSDQLLNNILPVAVADRLKAGEEQIVDRVSAATVVFADIVGFTLFSSTHEPEQTVPLLNDLFSRFDELVQRYGLEKIKTIGDAYLAVAGVPELVADHAPRGARMALAILAAVEEFNAKQGIKWSVRIGINSGPLVAGIIGSQKFAYDLWGDTVNVASRLESSGQADHIIISADTAALLGDSFETVELPILEVRNRGPVRVHRLLREKPLTEMRKTAGDAPAGTPWG